jgi:hypothetical protein
MVVDDVPRNILKGISHLKNWTAFYSLILCKSFSTGRLSVAFPGWQSPNSHWLFDNIFNIAIEHGSFLDDEDDDPTIQNGHVPSIGYTYIYIYGQSW